MEEASGPTPAWGQVPVPDPTELTTDAVDRAKADIRRELGVLSIQLGERITALDRIIDTRFKERDERVLQAAQESRTSLDAALAAAKEAVSEQNKANAQSIQKSELATQKQLDSLTLLMSTSVKAAEDKIADLKGRMDRGEGGVSGQKVEHTRQQASMNSIMTMVGLGLLALSIVASTLIVIFHK